MRLHAHLFEGVSFSLGGASLAVQLLRLHLQDPVVSDRQGGCHAQELQHACRPRCQLSAACQNPHAQSFLLAGLLCCIHLTELPGMAACIWMQPPSLQKAAVP